MEEDEDFDGSGLELYHVSDLEGNWKIDLIREGFKNKINYFRGIFREWGGDPSSVKIIDFLNCSENVPNALKHEIKQ